MHNAYNNWWQFVITNLSRGYVSISLSASGHSGVVCCHTGKNVSVSIIDANLLFVTSNLIHNIHTCSRFKTQVLLWPWQCLFCRFSRIDPVIKPLYHTFQTATVDVAPEAPTTNGPESVKVVPEGAQPPVVNGDGKVGNGKVEEMTSKDYYFDSYAHFGIHEVSISRLT